LCRTRRRHIRGTIPVLLTVTDPKGAFSQTRGDVTVVDQTPPSIACPAPILQNTAPGLCSAPVSFAPPTASDLCSNPTTTSTDIASGASFPLGTTKVTGRATDAAANEAFCHTTVTVVDKEPPVIGGFSLSSLSLWPPNHKMVDLTVLFGVTDNCSTPSCVLTVSSNEGSASDFEVVDAHHVRLRAERTGNRHGRIYTLTLTCTDAAGNKTARTGAVLVPHNR
jgi:HYR domain-containing protein